MVNLNDKSLFSVNRQCHIPTKITFCNYLKYEKYFGPSVSWRKIRRRNQLTNSFWDQMCYLWSKGMTARLFAVLVNR